MKYAVMEVTTILGTQCNKNLEVIEAKTIEEAIMIYKSTKPHIDQFGLKVSAHTM